MATNRCSLPALWLTQALCMLLGPCCPFSASHPLLSRQKAGLVPPGSSSLDLTQLLFKKRAPLQRTVLERRVPPYMLDLYHLVVDETGRRRNDVTLPGNVVRSFFSEGPRTSEHAYYFNLADIAAHEVIEKAELRLFKLKTIGRRAARQRNFYRVEVRDKFSNATESMRLISVHGFGWEPFLLTSLVKRWARNPTENIGVEVRVQSFTSNHDVIRFADPYYFLREPFLVVFSHDGQQRTFPPKVEANETTSDVAFSNDDRSLRRRRARGSREHANCKRADMIVDVTKIDWDNWILQPRIFNAYQCRGTCGMYSSKSGGPTTNHAIMQAILAETGIRQRDGNVQLPCCAPRELEAMDLLLYEKIEGTTVVKLKKLEQVIVKSCACL